MTTGGQHDGHRVAWWQITRLQSCRDRLRPGVEGGIGDLFCRIGQGDVETVRMGMHVPLQYLHQRPGVLGWGGSDVWHGASDLRQSQRRRRGCGPVHGPQQIADSVGRRQEVLREMDAAGALQAREELRPSQAVQAQVALQRTVQGGDTARASCGCNSRTTCWTVSSTTTVGSACTACGSGDGSRIVTFHTVLVVWYVA